MCATTSCTGPWHCKYVAALIYALIRKLSGSGFLYLKLLGVDVYELAKADAPQAEPKEEDAHNIGSASGLQVDPICL